MSHSIKSTMSWKGAVQVVSTSQPLHVNTASGELWQTEEKLQRQTTEKLPAVWKRKLQNHLKCSFFQLQFVLN